MAIGAALLGVYVLLKSSLVGLLGLFSIAVPNSIVPATQSRGLKREGRTGRSC